MFCGIQAGNSRTLKTTFFPFSPLPTRLPHLPNEIGKKKTFQMRLVQVKKLFYLTFQYLPYGLQVLPTLADRHRGKVKLVDRLGDGLQAGDGALVLPVGEHVPGKDSGAGQGKEYQDKPQ